MKKRVDEILTDYFLQIIPRVKQEGIERQRQADQVIVWLTALSTGAIALILTQSEQLHLSNPLYLKLSMAFLLLGVIAGVLFRSMYYPLETIQARLVFNFEGYCYGRSIGAAGPIEITDAHTIEDIAASFKNDLGLDFDHWLELRMDRSFWVNHYNTWADYWKKSEADGLQHLGKALAILQSKDPETTPNVLTTEEDHSKTRKRVKLLTTICNWSY